MNALVGLIAAAALLVAWVAAIVVNRRHVRAEIDTGDPTQGIVVFVEPVRWLFVFWGFSPFVRGLRRAGGRQFMKLFRWSSSAGALLVIPDLVRRDRLERRARRLTRSLEELADAYPARRIHLVGYSTGGYVALQACKYLRDDVTVSSVVLLAASMSPSYDWGCLSDRLPAVYSFHSRMDLINVLGPLMFGGNDRKWGPACGAVGFTRAPSTVRQRGWRLSDARYGYLGDHFTIVSPAFIACEVAPMLQRPRQQSMGETPGLLQVQGADY